MDYVITAELQFPVNLVDGKSLDDAREYTKQCLAILMEMGLFSHYHILSVPREVIA